ncbi:DNA polymerase family A-domain-containing protein, partial [Piptocephalis cylindrospora]
FNPEVASAPEKAKDRAKALYASTKGRKEHGTTKYGRSFWHGGSESYMFNALETIALQDRPVTPALGCEVSEALRPQYVGSQYMTSRVNWVVQSSGVDYLHLLLISMSYLCRRYGIQARFMISVHDELRYLVHEEDKYRAGLALQVSEVIRLIRREFLSDPLMPSPSLIQSVAFFSAVDMDHVLRKEVDMECITPSNHTPMEPGECCDVEGLVARTNGGVLSSRDQDDHELEARTREIPVPKGITEPTYERPDPHDPRVLAFLHAQSLDKLPKETPSNKSQTTGTSSRSRTIRVSSGSKATQTSPPTSKWVAKRPGQGHADIRDILSRMPPSAYA